MANFFVRSRLHTLECYLTTDFGDDEPFMWNFFVVVDGRSLRQNPQDHGRFLPSLTVVAKPGHHGNVGVKGIARGAKVPIPAAIGTFDAGLRPIPCAVPLPGGTLTVWIPGRVLMLAVVLDEESTSDATANAVHLAVVDRVQVRTNEFFAGLDLGPPALRKAAEGQAAVLAEVNAYLAEQIEAFRRRMKSELTDLVIDVVIREAVRDPLGLGAIVVNALDHDELAGVGRGAFAEDQLIGGNLRAEQTLDVSPGGAAPAWYRIQASAEAKLTFRPQDVERSSVNGAVERGTTRGYTLAEPKLCIPRSGEYWTEFVPQTHDIMVTYPFCRYRYFIGDQELVPPGGKVTFETTVSFPEFTGVADPLVTQRHEEGRTVTVWFGGRKDEVRPQLEHVVLQNDPGEGNFGFSLTIEAVLPDGRTVHVSDEYVSFDGCRIAFPPGFVEGVAECLEPIKSDRFAESRRVGFEDRMGPVGEEKRYLELLDLVDRAAAVRNVAPDRLASVHGALARAFNRAQG